MERLGSDADRVAWVMPDPTRTPNRRVAIRLVSNGWRAEVSGDLCVDLVFNNYTEMTRSVLRYFETGDWRVVRGETNG